MAEEHPPSPKREDEALAHRRSRIKSAMTIQREKVSFLLKEKKIY
jgi:hypothetical protein